MNREGISTSKTQSGVWVTSSPTAMQLIPAYSTLSGAIVHVNLRSTKGGFLIYVTPRAENTCQAIGRIIGIGISFVLFLAAFPA